MRGDQAVERGVVVQAWIEPRDTHDQASIILTGIVVDGSPSRPHAPQEVVQISDTTGAANFKLFSYAIALYLIALAASTAGAMATRLKGLATVGDAFWVITICYFVSDLTSCCHTRKEDPPMWRAFPAYTAATILNIVLITLEILWFGICNLDKESKNQTGEETEFLRILRCIEIVPLVLVLLTLRQRYLLQGKARGAYPNRPIAQVA
mmetsp:Transcript_3188/g.5131  ORF Transcript_3188/g.5131 Transcript_3188/m.5131 type:complete len:208 (+) Transcript_3188:34-657(+)|eukprot:CAMPEP_0184309586 /NCGR_PEP_ID=MMETSP1049-20130417/17700_1 /TAXON_ID=77928 /ORGANISM="Proteomonas sulcata, Strain CCMP704" /LENGTH=207 /DNA_ID=CAMNT_0026622481 /DNA_START=25 /DNA_END=648 /DNA_ORIENTATION=+